MKVHLASFITILYFSNSYADIYQTRDENGRILFTDRPSANSEQKTVKQPAIINIKKTEKKVSEQETFDGFGKLNAKQKAAIPYTSFSISSPSSDAAVRNNIGNIEVKLNMSPVLQTKFGHHIKIEYDGKMQKSNWKSTSILLTNLDRGSHSVKAYIVDSTGKRLKSSNLVTFHLQRFSRLFK